MADTNELKLLVGFAQNYIAGRRAGFTETANDSRDAERLIERLANYKAATPPADAALAEYCERAARNWTKGCDMYIGLMCAAAALRARPQAVAEGKQYHDVAQRLYELLDNIDTASDVAKSDDKLYRGIVERTQAKKRDYIVSCDGYTVVLADDSMLAASQSATGGAE